MSQTYSVSLEKMIDFHKLETVYMPRSADEILITTSEVNRPGDKVLSVLQTVGNEDGNSLYIAN